MHELSKLRRSVLTGRRFPKLTFSLALLIPISLFSGPHLWSNADDLVSAQRAVGNKPLEYDLDAREPASHVVHVAMTVPDAEPGTEIQFPAWNALYQMRDFVRGVQQLRAECDGHRANLGKPRGQEATEVNTWRLG